MSPLAPSPHAPARLELGLQPSWSGATPTLADCEVLLVGGSLAHLTAWHLQKGAPHWASGVEGLEGEGEEYACQPTALQFLSPLQAEVDGPTDKKEE